MKQNMQMVQIQIKLHLNLLGAALVHRNAQSFSELACRQHARQVVPHLVKGWNYHDLYVTHSVFCFHSLSCKIIVIAHS